MAEDATTEASEMTTEETAPAQTESTPSEKTYTQADLDKIVKDRLARQRNQYSDYNDLKSQAEELSQLREQFSTLQSERDEARSDFEAAVRDVTVLKIAVDKGLPLDMVGRLKGDTEEELAADADQLLALIRPQGFARGFDGGARGAATAVNENANDMLRRALMNR